MKNVESDEIRGISPYLANLNFSVQIPTIGNYVKSLGPIILILLITFLLLSFVIGWFTTPLENETGRLEGLLAEVLGKILAAGVLVVFGYWLSRKLVGSFRYMRRILRDPTRSLQDTRPPILYLRAFYEDSEHDKRNLNQRTPEERILLSFEKLGPVFAFGYPGEIGPPLLGATRIYFEHNDWQQAVINLCESAQVVVIDAALTDGVQWELTHLSNSNNPQKILISFFSKIVATNFQTGGSLGLDKLDFEKFHSKFSAPFKDAFGHEIPTFDSRTFLIGFDEHHIPYSIRTTVEPKIQFGRKDETPDKNVTRISLSNSLRPFIEKKRVHNEKILDGYRFGNFSSSSKSELAFALSVVSICCVGGLLAPIGLVLGIWSACDYRKVGIRIPLHLKIALIITSLVTALSLATVFQRLLNVP